MTAAKQADVYRWDGLEAEQIAVLSGKPAANTTVRAGVGVGDDDMGNKRAYSGSFGRRRSSFNRRQCLHAQQRRMIVLVRHVHLSRITV